MNENENKNDINYYYINRSLELTKGIPAVTLMAWLPSLMFLNMASVFLSTILTLIIIYLHKQGYTIIEIIAIVQFVLRNKKPKLYDKEEEYENKDI